MNTKKKIMMTVLALSLLLGTLSGCCINHEWQPATCTVPETCSKCGKTKGEALGHVWTQATCTTPQTCSVCGVIGEKELGHDFIYNDGLNDFLCSRCKEKKVFKDGELDEIANMMIADYGRFKDLYEDKYITAEIMVDLWNTDDPEKYIIVDLFNVEEGGCLAYFYPSKSQKEAFSSVLDNRTYKLVIRGKLTGAYHVLADQYMMEFSYSEIVSYSWGE